MKLVVEVVKTVSGYDIWLYDARGNGCRVISDQDTVVDAKMKAIRELLGATLQVSNLISLDAVIKEPTT